MEPEISFYLPYIESFIYHLHFAFLCSNLCSYYRCGWMFPGLWMWWTCQLPEHWWLSYMHLHTSIQWRWKKLHR